MNTTGAGTKWPLPRSGLKWGFLAFFVGLFPPTGFFLAIFLFQLARPFELLGLRDAGLAYAALLALVVVLTIWGAAVAKSIGDRRTILNAGTFAVLALAGPGLLLLVLAQHWPH